MIRNWHGLLGLVMVTALGCSPADAGSGPNEGTSHNQSEVKVCASGETVRGIDVYHGDGAVDWNAVVGDGDKFVFMKFSQGASHDSLFAANWKGAGSAGLLRGAYQFLSVSISGAAQADDLIAHAGNPPGELPPVYDVEWPDGQEPNHATALKVISDWAQRIQQVTGVNPMIYTSVGYWSPLGGSSAFSSDPLWVANYTNDPSSCPKIPGAWSNWTFWQYSESGTSSGLNHAVDLDIFNGSLAQLQAFAQMSGSGSSSSSAGSSSAGSSSAGSSSAGSSSAGSSSSGGGGGGGAGGSGAGGAGGGGGTPCAGDGDCNPGNDGSGLICVNNVCVPGCHTDAQCPGITTCVSGQCQ